jgi:spore coat polysaccharide biosynthesis predicted glycosyltransferase SpsG
MRTKVVTKVVTSIIKDFPDVEILIKIHPTTEKLQDYKEIISKINPSINIMQDADLTELINSSDIIIGFGSTSAYFQALILSKPILLVNLFEEDISNNIYIRENLITECKTASELTNHILNRTYLIPDKDKLNRVIENLFYKFDGKCSTRAAQEIIKLINNHHSEKKNTS